MPFKVIKNIDQRITAEQHAAGDCSCGTCSSWIGAKGYPVVCNACNSGLKHIQFEDENEEARWFTYLCDNCGNTDYQEGSK